MIVLPWQRETQLKKKSLGEISRKSEHTIAACLTRMSQAAICILKSTLQSLQQK